VSLIGTFIFFPLLGFSLNTLSMFGLVLAIGIVVDDAIVVVEAVIHHMEHGLAPREATLKAMEEVTQPVIGIALILSAVFVPVAFIGGLTGRMYTVRSDHSDLGADLGLQRTVANRIALLLKPRN
jgi:HAE1 family hydrophobic/amphiphilic exporter-1